MKKYNLPNLSEQDFCYGILKNCEFLEGHLQRFEETYAEFSKYRRLVPTYGAVLLNKEMDKVVTVAHYDSGNKIFPKGKINQGESEIECAIREVYEEAGLDITELINEKEYLFIEGVDEKYLKLFVVAGIDENTPLKPTVSFEIEDVRFYSLTELENRCRKKDRAFKQIQQLIGLIIKWVQKKKKTRITFCNFWWSGATTKNITNS